MKDGSHREAAQWIARLDRGALDAKMLLEFREWLEADVANLQEFERQATIWDQLDGLQHYRKVFAKPTRSAWPVQALAASIAAVVAIAAFWAWGLPGVGGFRDSARDIAHYQTGVGSISGFQLFDGSTVKLNTDTEIDVVYTDSARTVVLRRGEAFFDVASDADRPFSVETARGTITAIGTSFLVRVGPENTNLTVRSGRVSVVPATSAKKRANSGVSGSALVEEGQSASIEPESVAIQDLDPSTLFRQLAWRDGMLIFDGERLDAVVAEFNRYATRPIVLGDPSLGERRLGGYFPVGDMDRLLNAMEAGLQVHVDRSSTGAIVLYPASPTRSDEYPNADDGSE